MSYNNSLYNEHGDLERRIRELPLDPAVQKELSEKIRTFQNNSYSLAGKANDLAHALNEAHRIRSHESELMKKVVDIEQSRRFSRGVVIAWLIGLNAAQLMWVLYLLVNFVYTRRIGP